MGQVMNRNCIVSFMLLLALCLSAPFSALAQQYAPYPFTDRELDDLLAPIALYPDPLLAQMLPAATYPEDVADAAAWLQGGGRMEDVDYQDWDENVRAIAHYPDVLNMMAADMDWTADVGDAFLNQPEDVTDSIQRLRAEARAVGNLVSTSEQSVIVEDGYIQIVPAHPQYVYIPQYDPSVVYVERPVGVAPFIAFGVGLAIGDWLSMDFDWHSHHVIYHGWSRPGWVNKSRPFVRKRNVYVNRSRPFINQVWKHDPSHGDPGKFRSSSRQADIFGKRPVSKPDVRGRAKPSPGVFGGVFGPRGDAGSFSNRGRESLDAARQKKVPAPAVVPKPVTPSAGVPNIFSRSRTAPADVPQVKPPSAAFGGYRGSGETKTESSRGQTSRQSTFAPRSVPAPAKSGGAPAGGKAPGGGRGSFR